MADWEGLCTLEMFFIQGALVNKGCLIPHPTLLRMLRLTLAQAGNPTLAAQPAALTFITAAAASSCICSLHSEGREHTSLHSHSQCHQFSRAQFTTIQTWSGGLFLGVEVCLWFHYGLWISPGGCDA